jgi:hypothetical protein
MPILGIIASQNYPRVTNSYESIATVTVGSGGQSTITFSSIPSTYKHLQLRIAASTDRGTFALDNVFVTLNGDTGGNYSHHYLQGDGSSASAGATANATVVRSGSLPSSAAANVFGVSIFDILDYKDTNKYKTTRSLSGFDLNGTVSGIGGFVQLYSGNWRNTAAVNSITLNRQSGTNFIQYSHFALYGIRD